ncbi:hypothetical protein [Streptomyces hiroshimensis]|uniref:Secreted protein n=1 Tax=Streptomyces hiroshimensis TaxID=66424 RepID=A0ABQ2YK57_9ACTN|nr:hypothetical protein [Streptomyces hiroshimensis]GGX86436.1 hypothetical protein GCM10010324_34930 [Streptomyces hiroshimensis]
MGASRRTALMVSGVLCGALTLGAAGSAGASAGFPPPMPPTTPVVLKPSAADPEALREAAAGGARAIDRNVIGQRAAEAVEECSAAAPEAGPAGDAEQGETCTALKGHLEELHRARAALAEQAKAARPDVKKMTTATTDAAAATAYLAKDGVDVSDLARGPGRKGDRFDRRESSGLLSVVTWLLGGLVHTVGGVVGGLAGLVGGVLQGILD